MPYPSEVRAAGNINYSVPIAHAYWGGRYVGQLVLFFDEYGQLRGYGGTPQLLGGDRSESVVANDLPVQGIMRDLNANVTKWAAEEILANAVANYPIEDITSKENVVGNLVCDAQIDYFTRNLPNFGAAYGNVSICLQQASGIVSGFQQGPISYLDVLQSLPLELFISVKNVTGATIREALEDGLNSTNGRTFLQVGGIRYSYNSSNPPGQKVYRVDVIDPATGRETPLEDDVSYNVVMNNLIADGGDGFEMLGFEPFRMEFGPTQDVIVAEYLKALQTADLKLGVNPRIADCSTFQQGDPSKPNTCWTEEERVAYY